MKKNRIILILPLVLFIAATSVSAATGAAAVHEAGNGRVALVSEEVSNTDYIVTASGLNLRQGPSTSYGVIKVLKKGHAVQLLGRIGNWAAVYDPVNGLVGAVDSKYLATSSVDVPEATAETGAVPTDATEEEQALLDLVNEARIEAGVSALSFDATLLKTARLKAEDMAENNYFSHQSPTYGSPFDMMRQHGLDFRAAGENIAGNETIEGAFKAWISSEAHKKNILNSNFTHIGIGVAPSKTYGKVFVQQFIGK
jgi:uncharacterized YkwD family protein